MNTPIVAPSQCPICSLPERSIVLADLWELRGHYQGQTSKRRAAIQLVLAAHQSKLNEFYELWADHIRQWLAVPVPGERTKAKRFRNAMTELHSVLISGDYDITVDQVEKHFAWCRVEATQPWIGGKRVSRLADENMDDLTPKQWAILDCLSHFNRLDTDQIAAIFYPHHQTKESANSAARRELLELAHRHLVYRAHQRNLRGIQHRVVWALGVVGATVLERAGVTADLAPHVRERKQVVDLTLNHDLGLASALLSLYGRQRNAAPQIVLPGVKGRVTVPPAFVETDRRMTELRSVTKDHFLTADGQTNAIPRLDSYSRPDALAALAVELAPGASVALSGQNIALHSSLIPFLVEWDTGSRDRYIVGKQLCDYLWLHDTGSLNQRFPELDGVPVFAALSMDYLMPVVMITRSQTLLETTKPTRARSLWRTARERLDALTLPPEVDRLRPPIIVCADRDIAKYGLDAPCLSLWQSDPVAKQTLLQALTSSALPLLASGVLAPTKGLTTRPDAGRQQAKRGFYAGGGYIEDNNEDKEDQNEL